jgi:hypothetical protein
MQDVCQYKAVAAACCSPVIVSLVIQGCSCHNHHALLPCTTKHGISDRRFVRKENYCGAGSRI